MKNAKVAGVNGSRAQSAIEMALIFTFMMFALVTFLYAISGKFVDIRGSKDYKLLQDVAGIIQSEVDFAEGSEAGYSRDFNLPYTLLGRNYTVNITSIKGAAALGKQINATDLTIKYTSYAQMSEFSAILPRNVVGSVCIGRNHIVRFVSEVNVTCIG